MLFAKLMICHWIGPYFLPTHFSPLFVNHWLPTFEFFLPTRENFALNLLPVNFSQYTDSTSLTHLFPTTYQCKLHNKFTLVSLETYHITTPNNHHFILPIHYGFPVANSVHFTPLAPHKLLNEMPIEKLYLLQKKLQVKNLNSYLNERNWEMLS